MVRSRPRFLHSLLFLDGNPFTPFPHSIFPCPVAGRSQRSLDPIRACAVVPGCAHHDRAVHYAVTTDYRPPILTIPRMGGHQAPWDWSTINDGARRRSLGCVNYSNFHLHGAPLLPSEPITSLVAPVAGCTRTQPHVLAGAETNRTSEGQRNTRNTHCDTGSPTRKRQSAAVCRAAVGNRALQKIPNSQKPARHFCRICVLNFHLPLL